MGEFLKPNNLTAQAAVKQLLILNKCYAFLFTTFAFHVSCITVCAHQEPL